MYLSHEPFVYLIGWSNLDRYYIGSRYSKTCNPKDLFTVYYTSSKVVKQFLKTYGEPDIIQIRQTFINPKDAVLYEHKLLRRMDAAKDDRFLNKCNSGGTFIGVTGRILSEETKKKMSKSKKGKKKPPRSEEYKTKISIANKGKKRSEETKIRMKIARARTIAKKGQMSHLNETKKDKLKETDSQRIYRKLYFFDY